MTVKISCDVEEHELFEKALMWPSWKEKIDLKRREEKRKGERQEEQE